MKTKKISIIIPVYNTEKYIARCIDSVINQTYENLEIIIINDGSTDSSLKIINEFAKQDPRIVIIDQINQGVSAARNAGLDVASGDYIGFIDSDDYIEPDMYEALTETLETMDADYVECGLVMIDDTDSVVFRTNYYYDVILGSHNICLSSARYQNTINVNCNKLCKKELFTNVRYPAATHGEDFHVNMLLAKKSNKKVTLSEEYYWYFTHDSGASREGFSENRLTEIKSRENLVNLFDNLEGFEDVVSSIRVSLLSRIIDIIIMLCQESNYEKDKINLERLTEVFNHNYSLINKEDLKYLKIRRKKLAIKLFNISPSLFINFSRFYNAFKIKVNGV